MPHYLHNTTSDEVCADRREDALNNIKALKSYLTEIEGVLKEDGQVGAFPIIWGTEMIKMALNVYNEIARCNGAALVRGKQGSVDD